MMTTLNVSSEKPKLAEIEVKPLDKPSKNTTGIVYVEGSPVYFIKKYNINEKNRQKSKEREIRAVSFFNECQLLATPHLRYFGEDHIVTDYAGKLTDVPVKDAVEAVADFHSKSLARESFPKDFEGELFQNQCRLRGKIRFKKNPEIVRQLWSASELEEKLDLVPPSEYGPIRKILTHGDIHKGNVQRTESGAIIFIDFERAYFDSPTWDFSRALLDLNPNEVEGVIEKYTRLMKNTSLLEMGAEKLRKLILGDALYRLMTDFIADRLNPGFEEVAKRHYGRDRQFVEAVIIPNLK
ncbi:Phosphotransferase enzyme family protein [uncultured archaeon]|nr:Phosphotransferase enzyme family protein [uncultured archaeon]